MDNTTTDLTRPGPPTSSDGLLREGEFWRTIPEYAHVDAQTFLDHQWQVRNSVTSADELLHAVKNLIDAGVREELNEGLRRAPMSVRLTPYILSLIEWENFATDPLRRQYLPIGKDLTPDHPKLCFDPLLELEYSPVPGLTHRHRDAVLFLMVDICPVYCRFCTRSYLVGHDTEAITKGEIKIGHASWQAGLEYIRNTPEVQDVVLSGGDAYMMKPDQLLYIGNELLDIPNVRRIRIASKGPAVSPMKLLTHPEWVDALIHVADEGRRRHKQVCFHTHFNHPREITELTDRGLNLLFERGLTVRNQGVLLRGVNDDAETMRTLATRLGSMNVQSYYMYQLDMVPGVEDLRTPLRTAIELEKEVRGVTAGFQVPLFVVDLPGGGGKRDVHSFEGYNRTTGISVFRSPNMDVNARYLYFDPIESLPPEGQARWSEKGQHEAMIREALASQE
jgi:lysine 2,3-aminomutase